MKQKLLWLGLSLIVAALPAGAADGPRPKPAAPVTTATNVPGQQIIAYYFHGTVRCETCQKIESQARAVIARRFKPELDAHRLVFKPLNYDLPENAHFLRDYKLPGPSLVLVRQEAGQAERHLLLGDTWQLVETPGKFDQYIEAEVGKFLSGKPDW